MGAVNFTEASNDFLYRKFWRLRLLGEINFWRCISEIEIASVVGSGQMVASALKCSTFPSSPETSCVWPVLLQEDYGTIV